MKEHLLKYTQKLTCLVTRVFGDKNLSSSRRELKFWHSKIEFFADWSLVVKPSLEELSSQTIEEEENSSMATPDRPSYVCLCG